MRCDIGRECSHRPQRW